MNEWIEKKIRKDKCHFFHLSSQWKRNINNKKRLVFVGKKDLYKKPVYERIKKPKVIRFLFNLSRFIIIYYVTVIILCYTPSQLACQTRAGERIPRFLDLVKKISKISNPGKNPKIWPGTGENSPM